MDSKLFETLGQIAGIGGLAIGTFLLLFREVIRKSIFPRLTNQQAYRIIRLFMILTFAIALAGISAWIFSGIRLKSSEADSKLEIVDLSLSPNPEKGNLFPLLDIKLRNTGTVSTFIKRVRVEVLDRAQFKLCAGFTAVPVYWTYKVSLDSPDWIQVSQEVPGHGVDRFNLILGHSERTLGVHVFYKLKLLIVSDEDDKTLTSKEFVVHVRGMWDWMGMAPYRSPECDEELQRLLAHISQWPVNYSLPNYPNQFKAAEARQRGEAAFEHDTEKALEAYRQAVELDPDNAEGWNQLGSLLQRIGQLKDAEEAIRKVISLGEKDGDRWIMIVGYSNLGHLYYVQEYYEQAKELYQESLRLYETIDSKYGTRQSMVRVYANLGIIHLKHRDFDQAEVAHQKALELCKGLNDEQCIAHICGNLGILYQMNGKFDQAEIMYREALKIFHKIGSTLQVEKTQFWLELLSRQRQEQNN